MLEVEINGQHNIAAGFGRVQNIFRLTIAEVVDEYRFGARATAQFTVTAAFNADDATIVRQAIIKICVFAFHRIIVASQISQQMRRRRPRWINARRLQIKICSKTIGELFLESCNLRGVKILQNGEWQRQTRFVGAFKLGRIENQRLTELLADIARTGDDRIDLRPDLFGRWLVRNPAPDLGLLAIVAVNCDPWADAVVSAYFRNRRFMVKLMEFTITLFRAACAADTGDVVPLACSRSR